LNYIIAFGMKTLLKPLFLLIIFTFNPYSIFSQCTNEIQNPPLNIQLPYIDTVDTLSTITEAGHYLLLEGLASGQSYQFSSSVATDYLTLRDVTTGTLLVHGTSPVTYNVISGFNSIFINVNTPTCGSESIPRTITSFCATCDPDPPKVGVNTTSPVSTLDVNGTLKLGSSVHGPVKGMIRWNDDISDFEGYNGSKWISLTKTNNQWGALPSTNSLESNKIDASDADTGSEFGNSVSANGDYIIVGCSSDDTDSALDKGAAYIFKKMGNKWIEKAKLVASDGASFDVFGYSVDIDGDYAIVGALTANVGMNEDQGVAYVYKRNGEEWNQEAKLVASDGTSDANFGSSVAISGTRVIIGAMNAQAGTGGAKGAAYIFNRVGSTWSEQTKLVASDGEDHDNFGAAVDLLYNDAFVGAPQYDIKPVLMGDTLTENQGAVYQFRLTNSIWSQENILLPSNIGKDHQFGTSIGVEDYRVMFGAIGENANRGAAYTFSRDGDTWTVDQRIAPDDLEESDNFGFSLALSNGYAVIGANGKNAFKGTAYVYKNNSISMILQSQLFTSDGMNGDNFGCSVSILDGHIFVGSKDQRNFIGATYIFDKN
jgi:hypothetical protein